MTPFTLPRRATCLVTFGPDRVVAHNLDFDLVAVGDTLDEADERLAASTKQYIEFGLKHGLAEAIARPAPEHLWERAKQSPSIAKSRVIRIDRADTTKPAPEILTYLHAVNGPDQAISR